MENLKPSNANLTLCTLANRPQQRPSRRPFLYRKRVHFPMHHLRRLLPRLVGCSFDSCGDSVEMEHDPVLCSLRSLYPAIQLPFDLGIVPDLGPFGGRGLPFMVRAREFPHPCFRL